MSEELNLEKRRNEQEVSEALQEFIRVWAANTTAPLWEQTIKISEEMGRFKIHISHEHTNSIGNAYVMALATEGYVMVGVSNHFRPEPLSDSTDDIDAFEFVECENEMNVTSNFISDEEVEKRLESINFPVAGATNE